MGYGAVSSWEEDGSVAHLAIVFIFPLTRFSLRSKKIH